jgi:hypothetical protein
MANTNDRAALQAALAVVTQQIRGLRDLANVSLSGDLLVIVRAALAARERRRTLINAVLASLDASAALDADGYPSLEPVEIPPILFAELQEQVSDVGAAAGIFDASEAATQILVNLGSPSEKI